MDTFTSYINRCGYLCEWAVNMTVALADSVAYEPDYIYWMEYTKWNRN